jgi:hypothetical protein
MAAPTPVAHQTRDVVVDDHPGAQRDLAPCRGRLAGRDHLTHRLVPQHDRCLPRHIPVQQVAAAHAAGEHSHQHLAWAGRGQGALLDPHVTRCVIDNCLHDCELDHTTAGSTRAGRKAAARHGSDVWLCRPLRDLARTNRPPLLSASAPAIVWRWQSSGGSAGGRQPLERGDLLGPLRPGLEHRPSQGLDGRIVGGTVDRERRPVLAAVGERVRHRGHALRRAHRGRVRPRAPTPSTASGSV